MSNFLVISIHFRIIQTWWVDSTYQENLTIFKRAMRLSHVHDHLKFGGMWRHGIDIWLCFAWVEDLPSDVISYIMSSYIHRKNTASLFLMHSKKIRKNFKHWLIPGRSLRGQDQLQGQAPAQSGPHRLPEVSYSSQVKQCFETPGNRQGGTRESHKDRRGSVGKQSMSKRNQGMPW